jgi:hypothetical protein
MHSIDLYLIKKSELRSDKIDSLLDTDNVDNISWRELDSDILATDYIPDIEKFGSGKTLLKVTTDYFGGIGHQTAKLFIDNKKVLDYSDEFYGTKNHSSEPINKLLREIGIIKKEGMDEFDTVGLGKIRTNNDLRK